MRRVWIPTSNSTNTQNRREKETILNFDKSCLPRKRRLVAVVARKTHHRLQVTRPQEASKEGVHVACGSRGEHPHSWSSERQAPLVHEF